MRTAPASFLLSAIALTTWLALGGGCGGKVSVDGAAPDPSGTTASGTGGATATSTSDGVTAIAVGAGGAPVTATAGSVVSSTGDGPPPPPDGVASTGAAPNGCDFTGDCNECAQCSFQDQCEGPYEACANDAGCVEYNQCIQPCASFDKDCLAQTKQANPLGY